MLKQKMRFAMAIVSVFMVIGGSGIKVEAASINPETKYESNVASCKPGNIIKSINSNRISMILDISESGIAESTVRVTGKSNATKISIKANLQMYDTKSKSWTNITQWTDSVNARMLSLRKKYTLSKKGRYRTQITVEVWSGTIRETINRFTPERTY